ncbi:hypothetical protein Tsubulata_017331 [Turnera subulata]|uniref:Uncharacterized protein n=1 Tax=Turnera subulata TaxID=218843 RepID=A0A9Q0FSZ8_9ROSI|nr:hypothetical protein Tsubulata_017331 [Turnera subulata]
MNHDGGGGGGGGGEAFEDDDWDADIWEELIQAEENALSSSSSSLPNPTPNPNSSLLPPPPPPPHTSTTPSAATNISYLLPLPPSQQQPKRYQSDFVSYSPPRELSQRPVLVDLNNDNHYNAATTTTTTASSLLDESGKDREIERLKRELGQVSKRLADLEGECFQLRKGRSKRDESVQSWAQQPHSNHSGKDYGVLEEDSRGILQRSKRAKALEDRVGCQIDIATSSSKAVGVQTEKPSSSGNHSFGFSEKLEGIWGTTSDQMLGRNLISKLFVACPADFRVLFGSMSTNMSSDLSTDSFRDTLSNAGLHCHIRSFPTAEAGKVSQLYSALAKISNGLLELEDLFEPLFDLCNVENCNLLRDNVEVEGVCSGNSIESKDLFNMSRGEASCAGFILFGASKPKLPYKSRNQNVDIRSGNWVYPFELMHQVAKTTTEECIRFEAVAIMNLIVMRSNAYTDREKFGKATVFESLAELLKKEAGVTVRKEALRLLFLLLNCPQSLSLFCSICNEKQIPDSATDQKTGSTAKGLNSILGSLADCFACIGNTIEDLELRKRAMILLACLASSGKSGFEVMVSFRLPGESNFLMLILQVLVSEMDMEASVFTEPSEINKARTLLIREALILLNRLVSNPAYSATVLRMLTSTRDMASLSIDVASRLSRKDHRVRQCDSITRQMRESEIVELAQVFKRRVFTYLGDKVS